VSEHLQTNDRPNIQTYAPCTFTFSLQTFIILFRINAFINVYYNFLTFITSM